jgi:hypothetical protein
MLKGKKNPVKIDAKFTCRWASPLLVADGYTSYHQKEKEKEKTDAKLKKG